MRQTLALVFFFRLTPAHPRVLARCCSQFFISSLIVERSCTALGERRRLHSYIMCSAVWALAPHVHVSVGFRPQRCMSAPKRPTPDLRRFRVTFSFRGRSEPNSVVVLGFHWMALYPFLVPGLHDVVFTALMLP